MTVSTLVDRTQVYITSTGTGALTLGNAVMGFQGTEALIDGAQYSYSILTGRAAYEFGKGTYNATLGTLTRTPQGSSDGGAPISIPTNAQVAFTVLSDDFSEVADAAQQAAQSASDAEQAARDAVGAVSTLSDDLASIDGAGLIGTANGQTVQAALDQVASFPAFATHAGEVLAVNPTEDGVEWVPQGGGGGGVFPYGGASAAFTSSHVESTTGVMTPINWDSTTRDTDGFWSAATPSRLTIPAGVTKVRLTGFISPITSAPLPASNIFNIRKNGEGQSIAGTTLSVGGYGNPDSTVITDVVDVIEGDYFTLEYTATTGFTLAANNWFAIEVVERTAANVGVNANLSDLLDVDIPAPQDGEALLYDSASGDWVSGTPTVNIPVVADYRGPFKGALVKFNANKTSSASPYYAAWDAIEYDTDGFWSAAARTRLTIPAGITKVRLTGYICPASGGGFTDGENVSVGFYKNGANFLGGGPTGAEIGYTNIFLTVTTAVIEVQENDYFELRIGFSGTGSRTYDASNSFSSIEVIEYEITP